MKPRFPHLGAGQSAPGIGAGPDHRPGHPGLLIQDATAGFNDYLLHLGHNVLAGLVALNAGIALVTL